MAIAARAPSGRDEPGLAEQPPRRGEVAGPETTTGKMGVRYSARRGATNADSKPSAPHSRTTTPPALLLLLGETRKRHGDGGGGGAYLFVARLSHFTIDHASLSRRSTVPTIPPIIGRSLRYFHTLHTFVFAGAGKQGESCEIGIHTRTRPVATAPAET